MPLQTLSKCILKSICSAISSLEATKIESDRLNAISWVSRDFGLEKIYIAKKNNFKKDTNKCVNNAINQNYTNLY